MRLLRQQRHILLAIFILLGAALRLVSLGGRSLWLDEIFTAVFVSPDQPLANVFQYALGTPIPAPPLWFIVIHGFTSVLGASEFVL